MMTNKIKREFTPTDKIAIMAEYDHAETAQERQEVMAKHAINGSYIQRWRREMNAAIPVSVGPVNPPKPPPIPKPNLTGSPLSLDLVGLYAKMAKESLAEWYMDKGQLMDDRDKYLVIEAKEAIDSARSAIFKLVLAME